MKENNQFHIFSDFFNLDGAFSDAFSFFDDVDSVLMMCQKNATSICASLIKSGKTLFDFTADIENKDYIEHDAWCQNYQRLYSSKNGMPTVYDIKKSLDFMLRTSYKSDSQMYKYLEENAIFKDEYIL